MLDHIKSSISNAKMLFKNDRKLFAKYFVVLLVAVSYIVGLYSSAVKSGSLRFGLLYCVFYALLHNLIGVLFWMAFLFIVIAMVKGHREDLKEVKRFGRATSKTSTVHGSSRWATKEEIRNMVDITTPDEAKSIILGEDMGHPGLVYVWKKDTDIGNGHMCIIGSSGRGKGGSHTFNMCFQDIIMGRSFIVADPAGEVAQKAFLIAKNHGYKTFILNWSEPDSFSHSDAYNPLAVIDVNDRNNCMIEAQEIAHTFIENGTNGTKTHWSDVAENLATALFLYVAEEASQYENEDEKAEIQSLAHVLQLLSGKDAELQVVMKNVTDTSVAAIPAHHFAGSPEHDRTAARSNLYEILKIVISDAVGEAISYNDINPLEFGDEKCALFMIFSTSDSTYRILQSIFFEQMFKMLERKAKHNYPSTRLNVPCHLILDEFASLGIIPSFQGKINNVRKYGIDVTLMIQDVSQTFKTYGDKDANSILGASDVKIALGSNDDVTRAWIQKNMGVGAATFDVEQVSVKESRGTGIKGMDESVRKAQVKGELMTLEDLRTMHNDPYEELICTANGHPFLAKKFFYANNVLADEIEEYDTWKHAPAYKERIKNKKKETQQSSRVDI